MVNGIDAFREHFKDHTNKFLIIGGSACDILMEEMGLEFRATKDIDIILILEVLDAEFGKVFWDFIRDGGYKNIRKSTGEKIFFRFDEPASNDFPYMIELLAKKPDIFEIPENVNIIPIPISEEVSSLSAILLNEDYYKFIIDGRRIIDSLPVIEKEYLIPMKVKAFLDLSARKEKGEKIQSHEIKKHKNDVFRLLNVLSPDTKVDLPQTISEDMLEYIEKMKNDPPDLKNLKIKNKLVLEVLQDLNNIYQVGK